MQSWETVEREREGGREGGRERERQRQRQRETERDTERETERERQRERQSGRERSGEVISGDLSPRRSQCLMPGREILVDKRRLLNSEECMRTKNTEEVFGEFCCVV